MTADMLKHPQYTTQHHLQRRVALNAEMEHAQEKLKEELCLLPTPPSLLRFHESGIHHLVKSMLTTERKDG